MSPTELLALRDVVPAKPRRWGSAAIASIALHIGLALLIVVAISVHSAPVATQSPIQTKLVYVAEPGPAGGGGGSPAASSSRRMEIPRHRAPAPVPVTVTLPQPEPPQPVLDAPITTNATALLSAVGTSVSLPGPGGGGPGTGVGPGTGPGVGPGGPGGAGGGARQVGDGVSSPVVVRSRDPEYTSDAMRAKLQGDVELEVVVRANGTVGDVRVTKSLNPDLDQQAIKAAKQWVFRPGTLQGSPVDVYVTLIIQFRLH